MIFDIIKAIEDAKGSKAKTQILIDNKDNVDLKRAYLLAYSGRFIAENETIKKFIMWFSYRRRNYN